MSPFSNFCSLLFDLWIWVWLFYFLWFIIRFDMGLLLRTFTSLPYLAQVSQFHCCQPFQAPPRKRFQTHRWQIADWWSATPHQCLIFCSCFFLISFFILHCSFLFRDHIFIHSVGTATCNTVFIDMIGVYNNMQCCSWQMTT